MTMEPKRMMPCRHRLIALLAPMTLCCTATAHAAPGKADLSAFIGRWQIDPSLTHMGRFGPNGQNMVRSGSFSFVFKAADKGLSLATYAQYPQPAPTRVTALIPDGKAHMCDDAKGCLTVGGDPREQSFVYDRIDERMLVRRFYIKGKISEYTSYAVSPDRQTFTMIAWSAETPFYQNIQVFRKQP